MRICLTLDAKAFEYEPILHIEHGGAPDFSEIEYIEQLYQETMDARETKDEALESLWGPVQTLSSPIHIYVEGVAAKGNSKTGSSGAGIFFGPGSTSNKGLRVPGPGHLSADRARLFAIHEALQIIPSDKTIVMFCTSKMIIRILCYSAAKNTSLGWPGSNGDLFKSVVKLLARRHAGTFFVLVDTKDDNPAKREAYALAKSGRTIKCTHKMFDAATVHTEMRCNNEHATTNTGRWKVTTSSTKSCPPRSRPRDVTGEGGPCCRPANRNK
jgi:hypothetical protein